MKRALSIICVLAMLLSLVGCGGGQTNSTAEPSQTSNQPASTQNTEPVTSTQESKAPAGRVVNNFRIGTASMTGSNYSTGSAIAIMITELIDGYEASAQATGGAVDNCYLLEEGEIDIGYVKASTLLQAYAGTDSFERPIKGLMPVGTVMIQTLHVLVNNKAGISQMSDFAGKKVAVGTMGGGTEVDTVNVLNIFGVPTDGFEHIYGTTGEAYEQIDTGTSAGYVTFTTVGGANVTDGMAKGTIKMLDLTEPVARKIAEEHEEYAYAFIPANTYANQPYDVHTIAVAQILVTTKDVDEESIYQFTKAIYENKDYLLQQSALFVDCIPENSLQGVPGELHPGAVRYYKEIGLK